MVDKEVTILFCFQLIFINNSLAFALTVLIEKKIFYKLLTP